MDFTEIFEYADTEQLERVLGVLLPVILVVALVAMVVSVVFYILQASALYTIAKRRGISNAWLAWIPVGSSWIQGKITDHYHEYASRKKTYYAVILLVLSLVGMVLGGMTTSNQTKALAEFAEDLEYVETERELKAALDDLSEASAAEGVLNSIVSLAAKIVGYIVLYYIYKSCKPDSATLYLVLSVIFSFLTPFFLFACRKYDLGLMPPQQPYRQTYQPGQQTYQQNYQQQSYWQNFSQDGFQQGSYQQGSYQQPYRDPNAADRQYKDPWDQPKQ